MIRFSEIKDLSVKELRNKESQVRREIFDLKMQQRMQKVADPLLIRFLKRDLARIKTALSLKPKEKAQATENS